MKSGLLVIALLVVSLVISSAVSATPPRSGDYCVPTTQAPFDGGLAILLAAGVGFAVKKGYDNRNKKGSDHSELEK